MSAEKEEDKEAAASRRRRMQLVGGAVLLLLVGTGAGVGGAMMLGGSSSAEASETEGHGEQASGHGEAPEEHGSTSGGHGAPAAEEGGHGGGHGGGAAEDGPPVHDGRTVVSLGLFTVNLRGSGGGRVLRAEVQVEVDADEYLVVETRKPVLRDAIITLASDFSYTDLEGLDGKTHMRDELHGRLNAILSGHPKVEHVYFTEFVVQ
jgi:flagellar FliL protein